VLMAVFTCNFVCSRKLELESGMNDCEVMPREFTQGSCFLANIDRPTYSRIRPTILVMNRITPEAASEHLYCYTCELAIIFALTSTDSRLLPSSSN
jgi:hypothetical protein